MCKYPTKNDLRCILVAWRIDWNRCDRPLLICPRLLEYNPTEQPVQQGTICNSSSLQSYILYDIRYIHYTNTMPWGHCTLLQDIYSTLYECNAMDTSYAAAPGHLHLLSYLMSPSSFQIRAPNQSISLANTEVLNADFLQLYRQSTSDDITASSRLWFVSYSCSIIFNEFQLC